MKVIQGGPEDSITVVILWQRDHCNAVGPSTSFGAGYGSMLSLMGWLGCVFSSSLVTFKQWSGTITGCINL